MAGSLAGWLAVPRGCRYISSLKTTFSLSVLLFSHRLVNKPCLLAVKADHGLVNRRCLLPQFKLIKKSMDKIS